MNGSFFDRAVGYASENLGILGLAYVPICENNSMGPALLLSGATAYVLGREVVRKADIDIPKINLETKLEK